MNILWSLVAFIVALGTLVTVHEFGHFWVARRCGVQIERFSIGFGKTLWCRTDRQGTEYVIALIPLGGYVKMLDERVEEIAPELRHRAFNNKTILQRAAIVSAGPIANFLFAIVAYWLVFILGVASVRPVVDMVTPHSIAALAGISPAVELKSVDSIKTPDWNSVRLALMSKIGDGQTSMEIAPVGSSNVVRKTLDLRQWEFDLDTQDPLVALGIIPYSPEIESVLAQVQPGSAAQKAGLQPGDKIVKVDNNPLEHWQMFAMRVRDSLGTPLVLEIEREGSFLSLTLIPDVRIVGKDKREGFAGVVPKVGKLPDKYKTVHQYGPLTALYQAGDKVWQLMRVTVAMLGKLLTGDVKLNHISGPIAIAQGAGISAEHGLVYYLSFLALVSVNLGVINLFPLPVLDGGYLLFLAIEKLKGGPVSERVQDLSYRIGSILLMLLMGLALFNDFSRL